MITATTRPQQGSPHPSPCHPFVCTMDLIWSLRFAALDDWDAKWKAESAERGHVCIPTCLESAHIPSERQWESLFTAGCQTVETRNSCLLARELFCALFCFGSALAALWRLSTLNIQELHPHGPRNEAVGWEKTENWRLLKTPGSWVIWCVCELNHRHCSVTFKALPL